MQRELNEIEYLNWCVEQPYNMVVAARIRGAVSERTLRAALDQARERHPLLRVNTEVGANGIPYFSSSGVGSIPLAVIAGTEPNTVQKLFARELAATFDRDRTSGCAVAVRPFRQRACSVIVSGP